MEENVIKIEVHGDGSKLHFKNGKLHRENGPAIEFPDGRKLYYRNGSWLFTIFPNGSFRSFSELLLNEKE